MQPAVLGVGGLDEPARLRLVGDVDLVDGDRALEALGELPRAGPGDAPRAPLWRPPRESAVAVAAPIPDEAPVTAATRPASG